MRREESSCLRDPAPTKHIHQPAPSSLGLPKRLPSSPWEGGGWEANPIRLHHHHFLFPPQPKASRLNSVVAPKPTPYTPPVPLLSPRGLYGRKPQGPR